MQTLRLHSSEIPQTLDVAIVFGQGPNLPVILPEEATEAQFIAWETFRQDPLRSEEPDFSANPKRTAQIDFRLTIDDSFQWRTHYLC